MWNSKIMNVDVDKMIRILVVKSGAAARGHHQGEMKPVF